VTARFQGRFFCGGAKKKSGLVFQKITPILAFFWPFLALLGLSWPFLAFFFGGNRCYLFGLYLLERLLISK
jgi:hypothetical protein